MRMNTSKKLKNRIILGCVLTGILISASPEVNWPSKKDRVIDQEKLVSRHNFYREKLDIPPLEWSDSLADFAQNWADHLADNGCGLEHSSGSFGENIYWTSGKRDENDVVDYWAQESKYFDHENPVFKKGKMNAYGHYTQIIWRETRYVGAGVATCSNGTEIWVCSYDPPGNYINEKVY